MAGPRSDRSASSDVPAGRTLWDMGSGNTDPDVVPAAKRGPGSPRGARVWRGGGGRPPLIALGVVVLLAAGATLTATVGRSGTSTAVVQSATHGVGTGRGLLLGIETPSSATTPSATPPRTTKAAAPTHTTSATSPSATPPAVAPPAAGAPQPIGWWGLGDGSGTTAVDRINHHNGVTSNVTWVGGAAEFNGSGSDITVPEQIVDTSPGKSFTVSAAVFLSKTSAFATAVSQDGGYNSGFFLQYSQSDNRWAFARLSKDASNPTAYRALSNAAPALNTWTYLTGVYDGTTGRLQIYVNGVAQGTATDSTPFATSGDLAIGRAKYYGQNVDWFPGLVDDVRVFDQALTAQQVQQVVGH